MKPDNQIEKDILEHSKEANLDIQLKIKAAFHRTATMDASKIRAEVNGSNVTLFGNVRSLAEKEDAENAAWFVPGVSCVINKLELEIPEY